MGVKVDNVVQFFSFDPVTVFWPYFGHSLSELSDSNCWIN